jgi:hypothetical protein
MCSPEYIYGVLLLANLNEPVWRGPGHMTSVEPDKRQRRPAATRDSRLDWTATAYPGAAPAIA